jgi:membrane-anchored protein YejM (alkaline phosphatase superfamily)
MVDSGNTYGERVSRLVGWGHWFAFFNIIAAMLIGTRYITQSPWPETLLGQFYLATSWVGHFGFLVFALYLLVLFPLTFLVPSRKLFRLLAVCFATVGLTLLLIDTQAYQTINLHLTPVVWEVLFSEKSSGVSADLQHLFIVMPLIFMLQLGLSEWVWRKQRKLSHKHVGRPLAALFFVSFISSHLVYVWADAYFYNPITAQRANFPLSYPMTAKSFMERHGLLDREEYLKRLEQNQEVNSELVSYPLEQLEFSRRANPLNVLVVSVNNLRGDALNKDWMPAATDFAEQNLNFTNHYSSSNDTFGVFGLFYGLPSSYAPSIKTQGTKPIIINTLLDKEYQFGLFSGDNFDDPIYGESVFRGMKFTGIPFNKELSADKQAIQAWSDWVTEQGDNTWFSFIELTTLDNFSAYDSDNEQLSGNEKLKAGYKKSVQQADDELADLFARIEALNLSESTVIVLTSNHGTEFNETNTNSWGANSNYSRYQLQVPMVIHWPGKVNTEYSHRTSHLDLSVTLLQDLLGVSSNPNDFSSGRNLFDERSRKWILAGDSRELALITTKNTTVIDKFGNYKLYNNDYKRLKDENPTLPVLMQGLTELQRFYTKSN